MESLSYVTEGALEHEDTMGTGADIRAGDAQTMNAGTGIAHGEYKPSSAEIVHFLQIWIVPDRQGVPPRHRQVRFPQDGNRGQLRLIVSPGDDEGSLSVYQDARVYAGSFDAAASDVLELAQGRHAYAYAHVARGEVTVKGVDLGGGDGVRLRLEPRMSVSRGHGAEVLVFGLRAQELPEVPR